MDILKQTPTATKIAFVLFVVAKITGITAMVVSFAGNREIGKVLLSSAVAAIVCSLLCCVYDMARDKNIKKDDRDKEVVRRLLESGKLDEILKQVQGSGVVGHT